MNARVQIKRIYDPVEPEDGIRVLVDRLWPRGVRKEDAGLHHWFRDLAPSSELRRWFAHDPKKWEQFRERYRRELVTHPDVLRELVELCGQSPLTLLFAARDRDHNQAVVLREVLHEELAAHAEEDRPSSPVCYADQFPEYNGLTGDND